MLVHSYGLPGAPNPYRFYLCYHIPMSLFNKDLNKKLPGDKCPGCHHTDKKSDGFLIKRSGKYGDFIGCNRFPRCKYTFKIKNNFQKKQDSPLLHQKINLNREFTPAVSITL